MAPRPQSRSSHRGIPAMLLPLHATARAARAPMPAHMASPAATAGGKWRPPHRRDAEQSAACACRLGHVTVSGGLPRPPRPSGVAGKVCETGMPPGDANAATASVKTRQKQAEPDGYSEWGIVRMVDSNPLPRP